MVRFSLCTALPAFFLMAHLARGQEGVLDRAESTAANGAIFQESLWSDLGSSDTATAYRAMQALRLKPRQAVAYIGARLKPMPPADTALVEKLLSDLESPQYAVRTRANREMEKLGNLARLALEKIVEHPSSLEMGRRADRLLAKISEPAATPLQLQAARAIEVLEGLDCPEARVLLKRLSMGAAGHPTTEEAKASWRRKERAAFLKRTQQIGGLSRDESPESALPADCLTRLGTTRFRHAAPVNFAAYSADGKALVTSDTTGAVILWEATTGKERRRVDGIPGQVAPLVAANGSKAVVVAEKNLVAIDLRSAEVQKLPIPQWPKGAEKGSFVRIALSGKGDLLALGSQGPVQQFGNYAGNFGGGSFGQLGGPGTSGMLVWSLKNNAAIKTWDWNNSVGQFGQLGCQFGQLGMGGDAPFHFSPDGKLLTRTPPGGRPQVWSVKKGKKTRDFGPEDGGFQNSVFSPNGNVLAAIDFPNQSVRLWSVASGAELFNLSDNQDYPGAITFSTDGKLLACAYAERIVVWETATGKKLRAMRLPNAGTFSLAFSPDNKSLAAAGLGHRPDFFDLASGKETLSDAGHSAPVRALAFSPDGSQLASLGNEFGLLWDVAKRRVLRRFGDRAQDDASAGASIAPPALQFSPNGEKLLAVGSNGVRQLELHGVKELSWCMRESVATQFPIDITWDSPHPWGPALTQVDLEQGDIVLRDAASGYSLRRFKFQGDENAPKIAPATALSPDGRTISAWDIASSSAGQAVLRTWEVATGQERGRWHIGEAGKSNGSASLAFSADGKMLALASADTILLWDLHAEKVSRRIIAKNSQLQSPAFSPDGEVVAALAGDGKVHIWNVSAGKLIDVVGMNVTSFALSRDGGTLATSCSDTSILLWDLSALKRRGNAQVVP